MGSWPLAAALALLAVVAQEAPRTRLREMLRQPRLGGESIQQLCHALGSGIVTSTQSQIPNLAKVSDASNISTSKLYWYNSGLYIYTHTYMNAKENA